MHHIRKPYLLFLGDVDEEANAKTALGVRDWSPEDCTGQWALPSSKVDINLPFLNPREAHDRGARSLLIGVAPVGGRIPDHWVSSLLEALEAGLDLVSGMHSRLSDIPAVREKAASLGRLLHDIRHSDRKFPVGTGVKRSGKRLLTVGTDCALGKKYTALAITRELQRRGVKADFRATGQTGIMISGQGVAIDAVVSDFTAGAAETLSPANDPDHWDVIEGQGSIFHPGYAGVTVGLLHGSQADALVLCHDPLRKTISGYPSFPIPDLKEAIALYLAVGKLTNPKVRFVGVALNTSKLDAAARARVLAETSDYAGLPAFDPLKSGIEQIVDIMETL